MHYALPQRNKSSSRPPAYTINSNRSAFQFRRMRPPFIAIVALGAITTLFLLLRLFGSSGASPNPVALGGGGYSSGNIIIITAFDPNQDDALLDQIKQNRVDYAQRWGYTTFFPSTSNYSIKASPQSWAKVPAMRHAMTLFPQATYYFYLDPRTIIMNPSLTVESHIMAVSRLESLMITDVPIVPPDSVIKTFTGVKGDRIDLVLTQDRDGLSEKSFILRRGEWAKYLLDSWFDPLYRTYNFQKAERHALEHIVQWHGTLLAKIALVPMNIMNSYFEKESAMATENGLYKDGDFIINFGDCDRGERRCETEMKPFLSIAKQRLEMK